VTLYTLVKFDHHRISLRPTQLFGSGRFEQSLRQVAVPVHGPAHYRVVSVHFVKENVFFERPKRRRNASHEVADE
jgi:hypothetical protein